MSKLNIRVGWQYQIVCVSIRLNSKKELYLLQSKKHNGDNNDVYLMEYSMTQFA